MPIRLVCVSGARPNFVKLAPLLRQLDQDVRFSPILVHTGQHYDEKMSGQFFRDLGIRSPEHSLQVGSGSHAVQTAEIMKRFEPVIEEHRPDGVLVVGDVNSTMAAAVVAKKMGVSVVHVEAGLRSFDRGMPEEINRLITDAISDLLLVTEESGIDNLRKEGVGEDKMRLVGNLMIDSLFFHLELAKSSTILSTAGLKPYSYGVVTLHRPSNVEDPAVFQEIMGALSRIAEDLPLVFPVHPRTRNQIAATNVNRKILLMEPLGYLEFLELMANSKAVFTDSGGIQEETTALKIPCFTLRNNTERPVTLTVGSNRLAGNSMRSILSSWETAKQTEEKGAIPKFWDGHAASRCKSALLEFFSK